MLFRSTVEIVVVVVVVALGDGLMEMDQEEYTLHSTLE